MDDLSQVLRARVRVRSNCGKPLRLSEVDGWIHRRHHDGVQRILISQ